ncbi:putative TTDN1/Protein SICKLE [Plasmopara halstedii]
MHPAPPPPSAIQCESSLPMPPQLQQMMHQMQKRQPKFQQHVPAFEISGDHRGGRGRTRGHRGIRQQKCRTNRDDRYHQTQYKRKKRPNEVVHDALKFFMPSFLEDPWKELETSEWSNVKDEAAVKTEYTGAQHREEMRVQEIQHSGRKDGPGRVLFQPSFLEDPWMHLVQ